MNTTQKGDALEEKVYAYFEAQIKEELFPWKSHYCKIFRKKGYYSRDRERDIVIDVSIELYLPGAIEYSFVWLIECKNYSGPVPVDDIEEFYTKVQQVAPANGKAVIASTSAFQSGGLNFARNKKMGILRYIDISNVKWELFRSPAASAPSTKEADFERVRDGLTSQEFESGSFDLYMQCASGPTNSFWDFAESILSDFVLTDRQSRATRNRKKHSSYTVPYLDLESIEEKSFKYLRDMGYRGGAVSLNEICSREAVRSGLKIAMNAIREDDGIPESALGRILFSPLEIRIYKSSVLNIGRDRYTLAHELAHHLLSHGEYMMSELCDDGDFALRRDSSALAPDIIRMEYQANVFASSLLMPQGHFIDDFRHIAKWLHITDRGFGELFLDDQLCNYQNYEKVTRELMKRYDVSRSAVKIRLESLGLLKDTRQPTRQQVKTFHTVGQTHSSQLLGMKLIFESR